MRESEISGKIDPLLLKLGREAIQNQVEELQKELTEYEDLRQGGRLPLIELHSLEQLPRALIKARISLGLSQRELADRLNIAEQQIQRWESTEYSSASLGKIKEVLRALNMASPEGLQLTTGRVPLSSFFKRMERVGLDRNFIMDKILPSSLANYLAEKNVDSSESDLMGLQAALRIGRVFHWSPEEIFGDAELKLNTAVIPEVRFKLPKGRNELRVNAYTFYAHYLASIIAQATEQLPRKAIPKDPYVIHETIIAKSGSLSVASLTRFIWELGVPVIALDDPGAFHAACFNINNRNVIVLKQRTSSESRWMFDLLHEVWHAAQDSKQKIHIASDPGAPEYSSQEEIVANLFAAAVLLGKNPQRLAELCRDVSSGDRSRMKEAIRIVAEKEGVRADILANYVAFRYSMEGDDSLWGIAENLQRKITQDPKEIMLNIFLEYADLGSLSLPDLDLLQQAIRPGEQRDA
ncbi:XRE family transcriptional regulator [Candidatus Nitrososphaera evergladensis]|uniref:XRE family transcriptional regulator n=1 Tax=Candidatus Nitrososphaera evergladensis TaxID=1459637 RepID=UPI0011E6015A|nr:XRE family transcriptional regulator [Candidatus Nitrososphaera evergladensis]